MSPRSLDPRRFLHVIFGLFLATGLTVGAYFLWALADWIRPQGEGAFGAFFVGGVSFLPALLGCLFGSTYLFMVSTDRDVRRGVALTIAHLGWWVLLVAIAATREPRAWGWGTRVATIVEPGIYAIGMTLLAARWFWWRRGDGPVHAAA